MKTINAAVITTALLSAPAFAGFEIAIDDDNKIEFGGYLKMDARYVDGDVGYRPYWIGGGATGEDESRVHFNARETRFNTKYTHGDVMAFIEMDFYGSGGNEVISNSYSPRLRHAFIKYKNWLFGQTWSTFMNTSSIPETANFGGTLVSEAFIRQGQIRYTNGGLQVSLENPETYGGDASGDNMPDVIAKYTFGSDWGNVAFSGLARSIEPEGADQSAFGFGFTGRIKTVGRDDLRFQFYKGELGRYVGATVAKDLVEGEAEDTTAYSVAYRHHWNDTLRSNVFYARSETDLAGADRSQWGVNIFKSLTRQLSVGLEVGNYEVSDQDADSNYLQFSAKFVL